MSGPEAGTPEYKEAMMDWTKGKGKTAWSELYALSGIDPTQHDRFAASQQALKDKRNAWLADPENQKLLQDAYAQQLVWDDFLELRGMKEDKFLDLKEMYTPKGSDTPVQITENTVINYLYSLGGDQLLNATGTGN